MKRQKEWIMPTPNEQLNKLGDDVSGLKRDMAVVGTLVDRLDVTIEKLTEVSTTVSQLLAVQGSRLEVQEKVVDRVQKDMDERIKQQDKKITDLYAYVDSAENSSLEEIEKAESRIDSTVGKSEGKVLAEIKDMRKELTDQSESISKRVTIMEKLIWVALGGAGIISWLLSNLDKLPI